jgi:beta-lactamase class C
MMRLASVALITALMAGSAPAGSPVTDSSVERIVARELATWPKEPGGAAVTVRIAGRTLFFNEGVADPATKRPITSDSLFNLLRLARFSTQRCWHSPFGRASSVSMIPSTNT